MLLRSMSPQIIAVDELGLPEDFAAVADCARCGVSILGTIHAGSVLEVLHRLQMGGLDLIRSQMRSLVCRENRTGAGFSPYMREEESIVARIFGTVLILAGCAGFLYKWAEGEKARQRMAGNGYACLCAGNMHWNRNTCGCTIFCLFMKRQMHPCRHFLDEVCVCMRNHQNPSGQKIWQDCLQKHKSKLQIGQEAGKSLRLPREHFMAKAVQRICDAMKSAENGWKNFWQSHDWNFLKNSGCICLLEC